MYVCMYIRLKQLTNRNIDNTDKLLVLIWQLFFSPEISFNYSYKQWKLLTFLQGCFCVLVSVNKTSLRWKRVRRVSNAITRLIADESLGCGDMKSGSARPAACRAADWIVALLRTIRVGVMRPRSGRDWCADGSSFVAVVFQTSDLVTAMSFPTA